MKLLKLIFISAALILPAFSLTAQVVEGSYGYYEDALRFSQRTGLGTARFSGIAGAQTALGGDIGSIAYNPAGLGFFNKSEFSFTPSLGFYRSKADFIGNSSNSFNSGFNLNNLGIVFCSAKDDVVPGSYRGGSFGISLTRTNDFTAKFGYRGDNEYNSMIDYFVQRANGIPVSTIENEIEDESPYRPTSLEALAYYTFLLNPNSDNKTYYNLIEGETVRQREIVKTSGGENQWNFSYGGNYADKFYFGASLGLSSLNYKEEKTYSEDVLTDNDNFDPLYSFILKDNLNVTGSGINFSGGFIYRANDIVRFGGSFVTPTAYYRVVEDYSTNLAADFNNTLDLSSGGKVQDQDEDLLPGEFEYKLITPLRLTGGIAFFVKKSGFISADIEYVSYNRSRIEPSDSYYSFDDDNQTIANIYKPTFNLKVGGEYRFDIFRLRGGFALYGDPYVNFDDVKRGSQQLTAGAGIRQKDFYVDFALVKSMSKTGYSPYTLSSGNNPSALISTGSTNATFTVGFFF
jgi:hypothetical protein